MDEKALLIGFRDAVKLSIYLDYKNDDDIYVQFGTEYKFARADFQSFINFIRVANQMIRPEKIEKFQPGIISPKSMAKLGFVWLQENGYMKIEYHGFLKVMTQEVYFIFSEELEAATQGLDRYDKIKEMTPEARAAMGIDEAGRPLVVKDTIYMVRLAGYIITIIMAVVDMVLMVASIFNPMLLYLVAIIALSILLAYLLLPESEKKALAMFYFNFKQFMNGDFWRIADALPISRKTVELFMVLLIVMTGGTAYFSKAIPTILSWGKNLYGEVKPEASDNTDDVLKALSITGGRGAYYDPDKKCSAFANFYKNFFDSVMSSRVTLKKVSSVVAIGANNASLSYNMEGEILTNSIASVQDFAARVQRHKSVQDFKTEQIVNGYAFKIQCIFGHGSPQYFKRMKLYKLAKKNLGDMVRKTLYNLIGNVPMTGGGITISPKRDRNVFEYSYGAIFKTFDQMSNFVMHMEAELTCLQVTIDEISRNTSGDYEVKMRVVFVGSK